MSYPFEESFTPPDVGWIDYSDAMISLLLVVLGLTLAQAVLFFAANCIAWKQRE